MMVPELNIYPPSTTGDGGLCKCRPICKRRRRVINGKLLQTSEELLLEKPMPECKQRWPKEILPNGPCPLLMRRRLVIQEKHPGPKVPRVVRVCNTPMELEVKTPYLEAAKVAEKVGALDYVTANCPFCLCGKCCPCGVRDYPLSEDKRAGRLDITGFDSRVQKRRAQTKKYWNMYDQE